MFIITWKFRFYTKIFGVLGTLLELGGAEKAGLQSPNPGT